MAAAGAADVDAPTAAEAGAGATDMGTASAGAAHMRTAATAAAGMGAAAAATAVTAAAAAATSQSQFLGKCRRAAVFLVVDIERRQADVGNFLLTEDDFASLTR